MDQSERNARIAKRQESHYYWKVALFNKSSWMKLLKGAEYRSILRVVVSKLREKLAPQPASAKSTGTEKEPADIAAFAELGERDVRLLLIFSDVDWGWDYLHLIMTPQVREWEQHGNPTLETVKQADHLMTPLASQERTRDLVLSWASQLPTREEFVL